MQHGKGQRWWWLAPEHSKARCSMRTVEGDRCKLMARANGFCGLHAKMHGGQVAENIAGWSRAQLEKEVRHLRGKVEEQAAKIAELHEQLGKKDK